MRDETLYDLCVIGAGSAGLSLAAGATQLGLRTALVESGAMGGECLNNGCIPSKALLAGAKAMHALRHPVIEGLEGSDIRPGRGAVDAHRRRVIAAIAPHDSVERFEGLGVDVVRARATFVDDRRIVAGGRTIEARNFAVATGSRAAIPPIPGLDARQVLTNETIFDLDVVPEHLVIVGGGPIGIEMAQAHARLGARVTVLEAGTILSRDAPELVDVLRSRLRAEGIEIVEGARIERIAHDFDAGMAHHRITIAGTDGSRAIEASHVLIAAGRAPSVEGLGLEAAGVESDGNGIIVDRRLRTSNKRIYALGDVVGGPRFTHVAGYQAGIVIRNLAFRIPAKVGYDALPWVTFTDPELAHVGLTLEDARDRHGEGVRAIVHRFSGHDRAVAEARTEGLLKVVANRRGRILGCSILAPAAGEMIGMWALAVARGATMRDFSGLVLPYPTYSEAARLVAGEWYKPALFSDRTRRLVSLLRRLPPF